MISEEILNRMANEGLLMVYLEQELATELLQARQRIRELEEAQRWIPVSERLPEKNQLIDGYDLSTMSRMNGWYCGQDVHGKYVLSDGEFEYWFTHWRPLPEPPEVE